MTAVATRKPPSKLTPAGAKALHLADVAVAKLKAQLEQAEKRRAEMQARYRDLVPLSEDADERAKGIRAAEVGGFKIRIAPVAGSDRFSLKDYLEAGHKITAAMRDAMKRSKPFDRWTIKDVRGPRRADAVEPT
jgi:hypothetical protein